MKNSTLCFTGHRPQKLTYGLDEQHEHCKRLKARLRVEIEQKINEGVDTFLCGMAFGTDIWCGEIVAGLKKQYSHISLIACIPHIGQEKSWNSDYQTRYRHLLQNVDSQIVFYDHYVRGCMQKRNRYMVENADYMIAVFNGSTGGTKGTVEYAQKQGLDIIILDPDKMIRRHIRGGKLNL